MALVVLCCSLPPWLSCVALYGFGCPFLLFTTLVVLCCSLPLWLSRVALHCFDCSVLPFIALVVLCCSLSLWLSCVALCGFGCPVGSLTIWLSCVALYRFGCPVLLFTSLVVLCCSLPLCLCYVGCFLVLPFIRRPSNPSVTIVSHGKRTFPVRTRHPLIARRSGILRRMTRLHIRLTCPSDRLLVCILTSVQHAAFETIMRAHNRSKQIAIYIIQFKLISTLKRLYIDTWRERVSDGGKGRSGWTMSWKT